MGTSWISRKGVDLEKGGGGVWPPLPTMCIYKYTQNLVIDTFMLCLLKVSINSGMCDYKKEVVNILNVLLPVLAEGFWIQQDALSGFGLKANESTGTLLKLSAGSTSYFKRKIKPSFLSQFEWERKWGICCTWS